MLIVSPQRNQPVAQQQRPLPTYGSAVQPPSSRNAAASSNTSTASVAELQKKLANQQRLCDVCVQELVEVVTTGGCASGNDEELLKMNLYVSIGRTTVTSNLT